MKTIILISVILLSGCAFLEPNVCHDGSLGTGWRGENCTTNPKTEYEREKARLDYERSMIDVNYHHVIHQ